MTTTTPRQPRPQAPAAAPPQELSRYLAWLQAQGYDPAEQAADEEARAERKGWEQAA